MCAGGCIGGCTCSSNSTVLPIGPTGPTGATGATGATGPTGPAGAGTTIVKVNDVTDLATSGGTLAALMTGTVALNTMTTNGDVLEVDTTFEMSATGQDKRLSFEINGSTFITKLSAGYILIAKGTRHVKVKFVITRISSTSVHIDIYSFHSDDVYLLVRSYYFDQDTIAVADLSLFALTFACFGQNVDAVATTDTITQTHLLIKYFNK